MSELLRKRNELAGAGERPAAVVGEGKNELTCPRRIGANEARDRVQAVEEKVWLDLGLERL
jgi:hypothetical protein